MESDQPISEEEEEGGLEKGDPSESGWYLRALYWTPGEHWRT